VADLTLDDLELLRFGISIQSCEPVHMPREQAFAIIDAAELGLRLATKALRERDGALAEIERLRERLREDMSEARAENQKLLEEPEELREALRKILDKGMKETISDGVYATLASDDEGKP